MTTFIPEAEPAVLDVRAGAEQDRRRTALDAECGGKAANLARLDALGMAVPPWFCVAATHFDQVRNALGLEALARRGASDAAVEADVRERLRAACFPDSLRAEIAEQLRQLGLADALVAVRSSGLEEDGATHSFAGQFESVLGVRGVDAVCEAVTRCWASAYGARHRAYRRHAGLEGAAPRMAVVIQQLVAADCAGVAFSRNPLAPLDVAHAIVESVWGLGEGLVSGAVDADRFVVHRTSYEVQRTVADKASAFVTAPDGGARAVPLDLARLERASLTDAQARSVAALALRLEHAFGAPQDCEWAFADGRLWLLQARPITALPPAALFDPAIGGAMPVIWDNANIIESYAGVTTPLTFSHVSRCYRAVYVQFCRVMGVSEAVIAANEPMFRNMLGLVRGRVYYNLVNWYRLLALLPGVAHSRGFMETMMGVRQGLTAELARLFDDALAAPPLPWWRRATVAVVTAWRVLRARALNRAFLARMAHVVRPLQDADLASRPLSDLLALYDRLDREILQRWQAPIVTDFRCLLAFGLLKSLTVRWLDAADAPSLQNDLLCGDGSLLSVEPTRRLLAIAHGIERGDAGFRQRVLAATPAQFQRMLKRREAPATSDAFARFIADFGFRCADELKLESPDLHDDPTFALATIQQYVRDGAPARTGDGAAEARIRAAAESRVRATLRGPRRWVYRAVLAWARRAVRDREQLRFERTRVFGVSRRIFRAIGLRLSQLGAIAQPDDVFYLGIEELFAWHEGRALTADLRPTIAARRAEFEGYRRTAAPPDRLLTRGPASGMMAHPAVLAAGDLLVREAAAASADASRLTGTPCSPGVVEGVVRVARTIAEAQGIAGEILVTERTDPGWVPLFPSCAGLVVERGSLLSHSAVVARELGLPTIVGVTGRPLERLRTGQRIRMDATRGEITIL
ncbi:MAG: phosphoenolpyruvate synthase [Gemmatimonadetes bacterium]|nr:phosphoenolpyruvate synthase [Gemmatimonadota bacterium]